MERAIGSKASAAGLAILAIAAGVLFASCQAGRIHPERPLPRLPVLDQRLDTALADRWTEPKLMVGASKVDISPYGFRVWVAGFGPGRISTGMLDPVWARALYIDDGDQAVVLLVLDVVGLGLADVNKIRDLASAKHGDKIIVVATHNHEGPDTVGIWGPGLFFPLDSGVEPEYQDRLLVLAASAVDRAVKNARPSRLRFGSTQMPEGWAANLWFPDDYSKMDHELTVMQAVDKDGEVIVTLFNWALHAEALYQWNHKVSADWPGRAYDAIEQRHGGVAMFVSNAAGGMVIPFPNRFDQRKNFDKKARVEWCDKLAQVVADSVDMSLEAAREYGPDEVKVEHLSTSVWLPVENALVRVLYQHNILSAEGRPVRRDPDEQIGVEVHCLRIGPALMVTAPGELFPSIGRAFKEAMDSPYRFVITLANDEAGYMMLPEEWEDKTYKYERSVCLGRMTGRIVLDAGLQMLEQLGRDQTQ